MSFVDFIWSTYKSQNLDKLRDKSADTLFSKISFKGECRYI